MADKPSPSECVKKLEEQLTCSICLDHLTNPKILPCFHSFCLHCLEGVPTDIEDGNYYISCPTCRLACPVPDKGLAILPASFVINNFIEVYNLMKKVSGDPHASCDNCDKADADRYCKQCAKFFCPKCLHFHDNWKPNADHQTISLEEVASTAHQLPTTRPEVTEYCTDHNKPLEIYCETCQELICHNCTVKKGQHRDHDYDVASDVYSKNRDVIVQSCLQPLNQEIDRIALSKSTLVTRRGEVSQQAQVINEEIDLMITQIKSHIDVMGGKLKEDVELAMEHKVLVLEQQIKEADTTLGQVQECRDHVKECVRVGTPHQLLTTKAQIVNRAEAVLEQVENKVFQPVVEADIKLVKSDAAECKDIGKIICANDPSSNADGGLHKHVAVHDLSGVPPVKVLTDDPDSAADSAPAVIPIMGKPTGVAVTDDGLVIISEPENDCISILDIEGRKIRSFGSYGSGIDELYSPQGVAITSRGTILVADKSNHHIKEFTMDGNCISCVGTEGEGPLEFSYPFGIAVSKTTGQVLIADCGNDRVQVLNSDLTFSHMFGSGEEHWNNSSEEKELELRKN